MTPYEQGFMDKMAGSASPLKAYRQLMPFLRKFTEKEFYPTMGKMQPQGATPKAVFTEAGKFIPPRYVDPLRHADTMDVVKDNAGKYKLVHLPTIESVLTPSSPSVGTYHKTPTLYEQARGYLGDTRSRENINRRLTSMFYEGDTRFREGNASAMTGSRDISLYGNPRLHSSLAEKGRVGAWDPAATMAHETGHTVFSPYFGSPENEEAFRKMLTAGKPYMTGPQWRSVLDYDVSRAAGPFSSFKTPAGLPHDFTGKLEGVEKPVEMSERLADLYAAEFQKYMMADPVRAAAYSRAKRHLLGREWNVYGRLVNKKLIPEVEGVRRIPAGTDVLAAKVPKVPSTLSAGDIRRTTPKAQRLAQRELEQYESDISNIDDVVNRLYKGSAWRYLDGFMTKCGQAGVSPAGLLKSANKWKRFMLLLNDAVKRYEIPPRHFVGGYTRGPGDINMIPAWGVENPQFFAKEVAPVVRSETARRSGYSAKPVYRKFKDTAGRGWLGLLKKKPPLTDKDLANMAGFEFGLQSTPSDVLMGKAKLNPGAISDYLAGKRYAMEGFGMAPQTLQT